MSDENLAIIILAAGKGTRMNSNLPKILHNVAGKSLMGHVLDLASIANASEIVSVLNQQQEDIAKAIASISKSVYQVEQNGTADAVKPALEELKDFNGNVLIIFADTPLITINTIDRLIGALNKFDGAILGFRSYNPEGYGRLFANEHNVASKITESKDLHEDERENNLCNSGVMAVKADILRQYLPKIGNDNAKGEYYLTDIVELASNDNKKFGYVECDEAEVMGVNDKIDLADANAVYQQRIREHAMLNGVTMIDPQSVFLSYDTIIGHDVTIHPNVIIGPEVVIEPHAEIKSFSHIEKSTIGIGATIGPYARIRPGSEIGDNARIGNFVEVKKSTIGKGAKIGHLSYIGDADIAEEVNIGAGTVTCNYNGYTKSETNIGKGSFIGSNSAIIAPVNIGEGAIIGAGSTITGNVEDNAIALSRVKQVNHPEAATKFRDIKNKDKNNQ